MRQNLQKLLVHARNGASGVAAAGAAVAFYFYSRRMRVCGFGGANDDIGLHHVDAHFEGAYQAPSTWMEALFFFAEALRYMYNESLGRWRTADLLIGLAYLARQESANRAVADIAAVGHLVGKDQSKAKRDCIKKNFQRMAHFMKYCQALRERQLSTQTMVLSRLGVKREDILMQQAFAGMLKPSYVLVRDHTARCIVLAIRGTRSIKDLFTSLTSASKPHHMLSEDGVILGYSHFGMLAAARWVLEQTQARLEGAMKEYPEYHLQIVGHSLGAGTAALLTTRLRETGGVFANTTCLAIACPACMTLDLAQSCNSYVTTIINGHDMIPTLSPGAADALREEVMQSSWYEAFRADMRSSVVVRAVEASVGGVGTVTSVASSWTSASLSSATRSLRACYQRRGQPILKRSGSDADRLASENACPIQLNPDPSGVGHVEVARDWITPQEDPESSSWARILEQLEPMDQGGEPEASTSGRDITQACHPMRSSWPLSKSLGSATSRTVPDPVYSGSFWSRVWPRSCGTNDRVSPFDRQSLACDETTSDTNFDSIGSPPSVSCMQMERHGSAGAVPDTLAHEMAIARGKILEQERLDGFGAIEIADEVLATSDSPTRKGKADNLGFRHRRMTFPAGKIYHLVPARLVLGDCDSESRPDIGHSQPGESNKAGHRDSADQDKVTEGGSDSSSPFYEGVTGQRLPKKGEDPFVVISTNRMQPSRGVAPPIPPLEDFVLLEDIPQEVYGRIRLCSRMLADHFIPAYLGSLESALKLMETNYL